MEDRFKFRAKRIDNGECDHIELYAEATEQYINATIERADFCAKCGEKLV